MTTPRTRKPRASTVAAAASTEVEPARQVIPTYTDDEKSVAKTLVVSLGPVRAREALLELWADDPDDATVVARPVPAVGTLSRWRDDPSIAVNTEWAASMQAGVYAKVSTSANRVLQAAEDALVHVLEFGGNDANFNPTAARQLVDVWRKATDRLLAVPELNGATPLAPGAAALTPPTAGRLAAPGLRLVQATIATYSIDEPPDQEQQAAKVRDIESRVLGD